MAKKDISAEAAAVWVSLADLKPWGKNPRHNDHAVAGVVESIRRFGFGAPIIARKADGEIIAGHTRFKAAQILKLTQVPVRYLDLDPTEAHLLALADNKTAEAAEWDSDGLAALLRDLKAEDVALEGIGFSELEIQALLTDAQPPEEDAWCGMPEHVQNGETMPHRTIKVMFEDDASVAAFAALVGAAISEKTTAIWYPPKKREKMDVEFAST